MSNHATRDVSPTAATASPPYGQIRQRSRQACAPCRQRKRKCDGRHPCAACTGYGYDCQYNDDVTRPTKRPADVESSAPLRPAKAARLSEPSGGISRQTAVISSPVHGILEPSKLRYMGRHSSVAFPLTVGLEVQAPNPPRLHSFAYNAGIRREPGCGVTFELARFVSWDKVRSLMDVYRTTIHPIFGLLDMDRLYQRGEEHWHGRPQGLGLEALVSGVIGLGSLFSGFLSEDKELRIILHAKEILEDSSISRKPSIEKIAGWILRTIYVRATSRPHSAWMCSCTVMHLVEAAGLHQELDAVILSTGDNAKKSLEDIAETRERTAQVAQCLNILIAYDYGRSVVDLASTWQRSVKCNARPGDFTPQLLNLVKAVPLDNAQMDSTARKDELVAGLASVTTIPVDHDFLTLVKTDLVFCIYRRLRLLDSGPQQEQLDQVIAVGISALPAARRLVAQHHPWWNVIGTVFQFACVLVAIDTTESLSKIIETMETLEMIAEHLNTHLANEALYTARHLINASLEKKRKAIAILEGVPGVVTQTDTNNIERQWLPDASFLDSLDHTPSTDMDFLLGMDLLL